ncbi:MAG: DUF1846 domain-containing protein [Candidatus Lokiarchaeota archaeon]|nr:DUF1846 domain-containing protein [Candidatus Lokiarchaeota archaeon]
MAKLGFDSDVYLKQQSQYIVERAKNLGLDRLYIEFGGKFIYDMHAARILPGFDPNAKIKLLQVLKDRTDIIICVFAGDIERRKMRADFGITYDADVLKLVDDLREWGLEPKAVIITRFDNQALVKQFMDKLTRRDINVFTHRAIKGYPADLDLVVSDEGYGSNPYIEVSKPICVVTAPGPNSGKMATCLSQLYHEHKRGIKTGYAKFETFPIWNLPLKHPVNVAYESATADLGDFNCVDPFHLEAYNQVSINYNRDVEAFPLLKKIIERIMGASNVPYKSPTDMGVNRAGFAITDDLACQAAAKQELIRRYFRYSCEYAIGAAAQKTVERAELLMKELNLGPADRLVVGPARRAAEDAKHKGKGDGDVYCGAAIELDDGQGTIVTGKNSPLMHASSAVVLNAIKRLAGIPDKIDLISKNVLESIGHLKKDVFLVKNVSLDLGEALIALGISATTNPTAQFAMEKLKDLKGCEMHMTHMPTPGDEAGLRRLGLNVTSDPNFASKHLFTS